MSRTVWLNGGFVAPADAMLTIDDPAVRSGVGLFETMRVHDGHVPLLERHLGRIARSVAVLRLDGMPSEIEMRDAVGRVAETLPAGPGRIRVTATPHPTLLVEGEAVTLRGSPLTAISLPGAWHHGRHEAEHKTLSFLSWASALTRAHAAGADTALLLDADGRLGEAATANVFCVVDGALSTAPVDGLLPGVIRALVIESADVREVALEEPQWRGSDEMFATSAVRGVGPIIACDGRPVGDGTVGPITRAVAAAIDRILRGDASVGSPYS